MKKRDTQSEFEGARSKKNPRVYTQSLLVNLREDIKEEDRKDGTI